MADGNLWDQQEGEPTFWFHRFEAYRLLGNGRSLLACVNQSRARKGQPESDSLPGSWRRARDQWRWQARAQAWDQHLIDQTAAAVEQQWRKQIMGEAELLGRLSQMGRVSINEFVLLDANGQITGLNKQALAERGHLVRKITHSEGKTNSIGIEMYSAQEAMQLIGKNKGLFIDRSESIVQEKEQVHIYIPDNGRDKGDGDQTSGG